MPVRYKYADLRKITAHIFHFFFIREHFFVAKHWVEGGGWVVFCQFRKRRDAIHFEASIVPGNHNLISCTYVGGRVGFGWVLFGSSWDVFAVVLVSC